MSQRILIVEDDAQIRKFICYCLKNNDYDYVTASNGQDALRKVAIDNIDLVLLDLGLPDIDGVSIIQELRDFSDIPIIVVSARDKDSDKAEALDLGADDYLTKPFSTTELIARIKVAFRHFYKYNQAKIQSIYCVKNLEMDMNKHLVYLNHKEIHLTPMEYQLLSLLMKNAGKVLTTSSIIEEIYGVGYGNDTQALRALMAGLRRKIEINPGKPEYIITEIGIGYRMISDEE